VRTIIHKKCHLYVRLLLHSLGRCSLTDSCFVTWKSRVHISTDSSQPEDIFAFPQSLQANSWIVFVISSRPLPSTSLPIHYSLITVSDIDTVCGSPCRRGAVCYWHGVFRKINKYVTKEFVNTGAPTLDSSVL
jgi:hypothetical protein